MRTSQNRLAIDRLWLATALGLSLVGSTSAQLTLTGTSYNQNFNSISNGLPVGWSVRTNASASSLGVLANFPTATKSWADTTGEFGNCASLTNNTGALSTGSESASTQGNYTNRVLGVRQTGTFGDPGAAFVLQIADTIGLSNLTFAVDLNLLRSNANSTTWFIDYAVGGSPSSFTTLGAFTDPGAVGVTRQSFPLGADANNQGQNVWIRFGALTNAASTSTRDTFGIDNFDLSYNGTAAPAAPPINVQLVGTSVIVNWTNPAFNLQAAATVTNTFTNVPSATSPYTNPPGAALKFFRLKYP